MKILHIISNLNTGGAEMMLYKLLSNSDRQHFSHAVISLLDEGELGADIQNILDVPVYSIRMNRLLPSPFVVRKLVHVINSFRPDVIQGWMYHGNLAAQISSLFISQKPPIIWNVRGTHTDLTVERLLTAMIIWLCARLSSLPAKTVNNSKHSALSHQTLLGYDPEKWNVIPNGFDTDLFVPSKDARLHLRNELGLSADALLIGHVGRYHPVKNHSCLLQAAAILRKSHLEVHFVLIGENVDSANFNLMKSVNTLSLQTSIHLLGKRNDMPYLTAAFDIATSSSLSEGFPNVVGEAMCCGVPCVVTDVGDSAWIVDDTGLVVAPQDPTALAQAWLNLIEMGDNRRRALGELARQRVLEKFSIAAVVRQYEALYEEVLSQKGRVN